jgi:hypothetical protein
MKKYKFTWEDGRVFEFDLFPIIQFEKHWFYYTDIDATFLEYNVGLLDRP